MPDRELLIALDYDGTFTADPDMWLDVIKLMQARGHEVILATMRTPEELDSIDQRLLDSDIRVIPTSRRAKVPYLAAFEVTPSIWIDDNPQFLYMDGAKDLPHDPALAQILSIRNGCD